MKQVTVMSHPETKEVLTINEDNGWGKFRVDSSEVVIENNLFRKVNRSAFISVAPDQVENFNFAEGTKLPGIVQKQKSSTPFWEGQAQAINPESKEEMGYYLNYQYLSDVNAPTSIEVANEATVVAEKVAADIEA